MVGPYLSVFHGVANDQQRIEFLDERMNELALYPGNPRENLPATNDLVNYMLSNVKPYDYRGELNAIWNWASAHMRYTSDPTAYRRACDNCPKEEVDQYRGVHVIYSNILKDKVAVGDCDDFATLFGGLFMAAGWRVRIKVIASSPDETYNHVYIEVQAPNSDHWIPIDATVPRHGPGDEVHSYKRPILHQVSI